ncbi:hypothetical protein DHEL01_v211953 [Diaporthe helianthi]|uniref:Amino acid permease n=1 Tax=Diaporthe helianthi TaxID=158607 RepID=A0A2P5HHC7_DIAHE|nr:hypothetical protein DHEL01_v211953 [Diaporthe helianthi]
MADTDYDLGVPKLNITELNVQERLDRPRENASFLEKDTRTNMHYAMLNGGPAAYVFNYIICISGALPQAACFAELSSIIPIAGAQYYWTFHLAPPRTKRFLTWIQGWSTWLGYISILASSVNVGAVTIEATVQLNSPGYVNGGWHTTVLVLALLSFYLAVNIWFFRIVPWSELACGLANIIFFLVTIVALWVLSPRNPPDFLLRRISLGGWENEFLAWNIGLLTQVWQFVGLESVVHMGEETKNVRRSAPISMFWSMVVSGVMGFIAVITYTICMPKIDDMMTSSNPFLYLLLTSTGSRALTTFLGAGLILLNLGCNMSVFSSASRLTWAWARDGGLPMYFSLVDGKYRVPIRSVLLTWVLCALLALLNIGSGTYIALGAINSLSSLASYFSYSIILCVTLHTRLTTQGTADE